MLTVFKGDSQATKVPLTISELSGAGSKSHQDGACGVYQATADLDLAILGEGSTQARWHSHLYCTGEELNTKVMVTVPPALTLKPHNSAFLWMSLVPHKVLFLHWGPG